MAEKVIVQITPDTTGIDELTEKAKKLRDILEEAMELANSIANVELNIRFSAELKDSSAELASITTL